MEAVGQLAGGIAHDFSNILTAVGLSADLLAEAVPVDHDMRPEIDTIRQAARRGTALTSQLLQFARRGKVEVATLDLNTVITDALGWLRRLVGRNITLVERLAPGGAPVRADRNQIEQVLLNLVVNARDAMPGGGTLTVSTERLGQWHPVTGTPCQLRGAVVRLRVHDTGAGMDERTRARIFEPFFSTKGRERGTGLGLAIVAGIVKQAGGCIELVSQVGIGSRFDIVLPDGERHPLPDAEPEPREGALIA
jgi:signal transduction histidine kinase